MANEFQKGPDERRGKGGKRPGAGRKPDEFKDKCRKIVEDNKLVEFLADVASGKDFEQGVGEQGEVIKIPASIRDRTKATELLIDRGYGKAPQTVDEDLKDFVRTILVRPK